MGYIEGVKEFQEGESRVKEKKREKYKAELEPNLTSKVAASGGLTYK